MRYLFLTAFLFALTACPAADEAPRNPFWPIGYEGARHPISAEPRLRPEPKAEPAQTDAPARTDTGAQADEKPASEPAESAASAESTEEKLWAEALKAMDFGSALNFSSAKRSGAAVTINGRCYGVGDLVSKTVGDRRFTWSVESIAPDGKLKLKRLQHRSLGKNEEK